MVAIFKVCGYYPKTFIFTKNVKEKKGNYNLKSQIKIIKEIFVDIGDRILLCRPVMLAVRVDQFS